MRCRFVFTGSIIALAALGPARAQSRDNVNIYERLQKVSGMECKNFVDDAMRKTGGGRFGPHQQESMKAEFAGTCFLATQGAAERIDDLIQTGKVSRARFFDCVARVERGEFPSRFFELQRLEACVTSPMVYDPNQGRMAPR